MTDTRTLLILALASVIIVPWIVCLVLQSSDNPRDEDADRQRLIDGDRFAVPPFHSAPLVAEAQRDHV